MKWRTKHCLLEKKNVLCLGNNKCKGPKGTIGGTAIGINIIYFHIVYLILVLSTVAIKNIHLYYVINGHCSSRLLLLMR